MSQNKTTLNKQELIKYLNEKNFTIPEGFETTPDNGQTYTITKIYGECTTNCQFKNCDECTKCPISITEA